MPIFFHFSHIVTNAQQRWSIHNIVLSILAKQVDGVGEAIESHKKDSLIQQKPGTSSEPASSSSSFSYTSARGTKQVPYIMLKNFIISYFFTILLNSQNHFSFLGSSFSKATTSTTVGAAVVGSNVSLRCSVFGLPSAFVSWWQASPRQSSTTSNAE